MALEINEGYKQLDTKTLNQEEKLRQMVEMARQLEASAMQVLDIYNKRNENAHENLRPETLDAEQVDVNESTEAVRTELEDVRKTDETLDNKPLSFEEMSVDKNLIDNIDIDSILAQDKAQVAQSYDEMQANLQRIARRHQEFLARIAKYPSVENARTLGVILAFDLKTTQNTDYYGSFRDKLYNFFISEGVILRPVGNIIYILPPYIITDKQLDRVYNVLERAIQKFSNQ